MLLFKSYAFVELSDNCNLVIFSFKILFIPVCNRRCFNACLSLDCAVDTPDAFARDCFLSERTGKHIMVIQ